MQMDTALTTKRNVKARIALIVPLLLVFMCVNAQAFTLTVTGSDGGSVNNYRWMVEADTTNITVPGRQVPNVLGETSISIDIHNSYAPVLAKGHSTSPAVDIDLPAGAPYFVTVMPDAFEDTGVSQYALSGTTVSEGQAAATVTVNRMPLPTAQIYLIAFIDHNPISNAKDEREDGLGGASIYLFDFSGGQLAVDAFGNPLGSTYQTDIFGEPLLGPDGAPFVDQVGSGALTTLSQDDIDAGNNPYNLKVGEAQIKYLVPGKYGVRVVPPQADDSGNLLQWVQTSTIEGTPTIDAWVQEREPKLFVEGFGIGVWHAMFGFVNYSPSAPVDPAPWIVHGQEVTALQGNVLNDTGQPAGTGSISGTVRFNHFNQPPNVQGLNLGSVVDQCWVGLNDAVLIAENELVPIGGEPPVELIDALKPSAGLYAVPCDENGNFTFTGIPAGEYQLVTWDTPLDALFGTNTVTVPGVISPDGDDVVVGDVLSFRWFGTLEGTVFFDTNENGIQDAGEPGMFDQAVNLRFRDGTIYQANATGADGSYSFSEVFPFFKWLVPEVDFARFKATGMTTAIDYGGAIDDLFSPVWPSNGNKSLQPQDTTDTELNVFGTTDYRTEQGPVLTTAMHLLLNQTNLIDWGKQTYAANENGGISGVVFYDTTRAEDDPKYNGGEPWQPGIPRVQLNLFQDAVTNATGFPPGDGIIDDIDGSGGITSPDVDNYPFDWTSGGSPGPEDVDNGFTGADIGLGDGVFDMRDAIEVTWSDSWDDNKPTGCVQDLPSPHGVPIPECADGYGTWNQVRPGVFDGGYAFGPEVDCPDGICPDWVELTDPVNNVGYLKPGDYIVEAVPPPLYEIGKSQDKNVDFGHLYIPSPLALPPACVGEPYVVPAELTLFPGVPANLAGQSLFNCDRKIIRLSNGQNAAGDFFMFTEVPKAARVFGFANNDLGAEFNQASPIYGEKLAVPWIPVAFRDWTGQELFRVYADEWGHYNALLPSTYTINAPSASGVAPNMITMVLNDPIRRDGTVDPWYNPNYSVTPWTFNYQPGTTTYTDTPMVPVAAFTTAEVGLDTNQADFGPVIGEVFATAAGPGSGPLVCTDTNPLPASVTLTSLGLTEIINPDWDPTAEPPLADPTITRDYGFGAPGTTGNQVTLDGVPLAIVSWSDSAIVVTIPSLSSGGTLMVTRGDSGISTELGVNLNVQDCNLMPPIRVPGDWPTIQQAVDAAPYTPDAPGALILVAPGTYNENIIINKPVRLQGAGAGTTFIDGNPTPISKLDEWHARIEPPASEGGYNGQALEDFMLKNPFSENEAPVIIVFGEQFFPSGVIGNFGTLPLENVFNPGYRFGTADDLVNPDGTAKIPFEGVGAPVAGEAIPGQSLIDGFTLSGSKAGGGIYVFTRVRGIQISNNEIVNNQGNYAGGISVGVPDAGFQMYDEDDFRFRTAGFQNTDVVIRHNKIHKNGGFQGAGGIAVSEDSHGYLIEDNLVIGNFSRFHGGGIAHIGRSDDVVIKDNRILFNENFFGAILLRAGDGGGIYVGGDLAGGTGSGNVTIDGNLIQGNMTGSGSGGGIRVNAMSGLDVRSIGDPDLICEDSANCPFPWPLFSLTMTNNIIVDNIAALDGGGVSLQDVSRGLIAHNTIANNDSTAVGREAFPAGDIISIPMPAGVAAHPHSAVLQDLWVQAQIQSAIGTNGKVWEFCIEGLGNPVGFENPPQCFGTPDPTYPSLPIANNIIWHNNSWFFDGTTIDPSTNAIVGSIEPNSAGPYWDVGLVDSTTDVLSPTGGIMSPGHGYPGNLDTDPMFVSEYTNLIEAATIIDEGGNNINMRFTPLAGDPVVVASDYHIDTGSPAIDAALASTLPLLDLDVDDEPRPAGVGADIGADENLAAAPLDVDTDGDGVADDSDNCTLVANPDQIDSNGDGFGSVCDTDLNNDGITNGLDVGILKMQFLTAGPDADFNGDGVVNGIDVEILKTFFLQPPGPSGVAP